MGRWGRTVWCIPTFENQCFADLEARLVQMSVVIAPSPFEQIFDQDTGLPVHTHLLTHQEDKWQVGSLDLVEADEESCVQLLRSAAHVAANEETLLPTEEINSTILGD